MVGQHHPGVAQGARGEGHHLDRVDPIGPVRMYVRVAAHVGQRDELGKATGERGLDLATVLAQLGRDPGQAEALVDLVFGGNRLHLAALHDLEALLREGQAALERHAAQGDVVLLAAGEVDQMATPSGRWADHQVDLGAVGQDDARLVGTGVEHVLNAGQRVERLDQAGRVVGGSQQVQVTDRGLAPSERSGRLDGTHPANLAQRVHQAGHQRIRVVQQQARAARGEPGHGAEDVLLRACRKPFEPPQGPALGGGPQRVDRVDPQLLVQLLDGPRPHPRDLQDLEQPTRHLGAHLVVVGQLPGGRQLGQLRAERGAGARDLWRVAGDEEVCDVIGPALNGVGHAAIGDRFVDDFAGDLEHVGDLVEDAGHLRVADDGGIGARDGAWTRHGRHSTGMKIGPTPGQGWAVC